MAGWYRSAARTTCKSRPGSGVLSFVRFIHRQSRLSCPQHCPFQRPCPVDCGADTSVAASGTVATGGLFGAVLSAPVGALIVSCEG
jgi:hypothetical protein